MFHVKHVDQLEVLVETLVRWQKAINLVGKHTLDGVWKRHVLDSAQLSSLIPAEAKTLADLGSGGGFPGLVIAAMRPDLEITLIESDARKAAFLGEAGRKMGLEKQPKARDQTDRSRRRRPRPTSSRPGPWRRWASCWNGPTAPDGYRYLPFPQGERLAGRGGRGQEETGTFPRKPFASVTDRDAVILRIGPYRRRRSSRSPTRRAASVRRRRRSTSPRPWPRSARRSC